MNTGQPGRTDHLLRINIPKTGYILRHRTGKQLHILREIPDMRPQTLGIPRAYVRPVYAHLARQRRPDIEQQLAQGGLARRAGPDDRQRLPRRHPE